MDDPKKLDIDLGFLDKQAPNYEREIEKESQVKEKPEPIVVHQVRPWVRYWARYIDIIIFAIVFSVFLAIFMPSVLETSDIVLGILIAFAWVFAESVLLSTWGTTPGKWLLRVSLSGPNGNSIDFSTALNRSFVVWFRGFGMGIPIILLFTLISSYSHLTKEGTTSWDRDGHFTVSHGEVGVIRIMVAVIIFISFLILIGLAES